MKYIMKDNVILTQEKSKEDCANILKNCIYSSLICLWSTYNVPGTIQDNRNTLQNKKIHLPTVMVNFTSQFDWTKMPPKLVTCSFWICWWSCLWKRLASGLINWVKVTLTSAVGIIQPTEGLNRTRSWRKGKFALFHKLEHTFSPVLDISTPGSQVFELKMGLTVSFSCSQSFELILNYTMRFLGAPAWRQLIMEFLSLHNGMSKFL